VPNHPDCTFRRKAVDRHLCNFFLDQSEFGNALPKLFSFDTLFGCNGDAGLHATDCAAAEPGASVVENGHRDLESLTLLAQQVFQGSEGGEKI